MRPLLIILALSATLSSGCASVGRGGKATYEWSAATFTENPASIAPSFVGLGVGAIAASPLLLLSWPGTAIALPADADDEDRIWGTLAPLGYVGGALSTVLGGIFYPFGIPFMNPEIEGDDWNDDEGWDDDGGRDFDDGPPGGELAPVPAPWLEPPTATSDGLPAPPLRRELILPWEDYQPAPR